MVGPQNTMRALKSHDYQEAIAEVRLHQNDVGLSNNTIDISLSECEVGSFIERLRKQIDKVTIEFKPHHLKSKMSVDIFFKEKKE